MHELPDILEQEKFENMVRDALTNLFDQAALQIHPLAAYLERSAPARSRGEGLRKTLEAAIERLRPADDPPRPGALEWRPYLILRWRYMDGARLQDIQERLALSERQLRREHSRALQAVAALLWDQLTPTHSTQPAARAIQKEEETTPANAFPVSYTLLDIRDLIQSVVGTLQNRLQNEALTLVCQAGEDLPPVLSDRIILRQILIRLTSYALDTSAGDQVTITCEVQAGKIQVVLEYQEEDVPVLHTLQDRTISGVRYWTERIKAELERIADAHKPGSVRLVIRLPHAIQPVLLVVDDQETAHRMYRRYLSKSSVRIVSLQDGGRVVETARTLQPNAIALDVMIPTVDGWEVLQALRANPDTQHIPVLICSVWEEPELAFSLGATEFLKKPISQKDFLAALGRLGLM